MQKKRKQVTKVKTSTIKMPKQVVDTTGQETENESSSLRRCRQLQWLRGARLNEVGAEMQAGGLDELKMENVHSMLRAIFNQQALIAAGWTSQTS